MQYKLYEHANNDVTHAVEEVLKNRGIADCRQYLNLDSSVVNPYQRLNNINEAVALFMKHFSENNKISILVDSDPDGYCSAAMMYMYIKRMKEDYPVQYLMHTVAKAHGLSSKDYVIPENVKLLIVPDAGTNDSIECAELQKQGIDVLILDHHKVEVDNNYATIVNNQTSGRYTNKDLCGAGVVYRFLQALDEENWNEFADDYLDLCALANISDVMDMRSYETKYLTSLGLLNINNKCFKSLINAQDYSMGGKVNIHNVQWYITPILNGMIRIGSQDEKELLFRAFIEQDEWFEYKKRATKGNPAEIVQENIYDRAARLCKNIKAKQDKLKTKESEQIFQMADKLPKNDKAIVLDVSDVLDRGLTGVVAIKIAEQFNKPCILLNKDVRNGKIVYSGSARNTKHSPIDSFKDIINSCKSFNYGMGHANAFGVGLDLDKKDQAIVEINQALKDIEYDTTYFVDFIMEIDDMPLSLIIALSELEDIIGQGIDEPLIAIENIELNRDCFEVIGKNEDVIKFEINDINYIQFRCKNGNPLYDWLQDAWSDDDSIKFNIVGKPTINEYNGIRTPQIIIEDIAIVQTNDNSDNEEW